jgi:hypothetical protein
MFAAGLVEDILKIGIPEILIRVHVYIAKEREKLV